MDSVVNPSADTSDASSHRLAEWRALRRWRAGHSWTARTLALIVPVLAAVAGCLLAVGNVQAKLQIEFDPMRPAMPAAAPAPAASGAVAAEAVVPAAPALPTLRITRLVGGTAAAGTVLSALVDDTWVRRGDVVAGYRVTALRNESVDLVNLADPTQRLTLRLNPVSVERLLASPAGPSSAGPSSAGTSSAGTRASAAMPTWPSVALEKKP